MDNNLNSLQVDVLQIAVVEVQVASVSFLISELHQVCEETQISLNPLQISMWASQHQS